jgi:3-oxoacyl-[acyl-carrier-protein] synthase-1
LTALVSTEESSTAADAVIIGVGARSASGLTALQVTMAARALHFDPRPSHMVARTGEPMATARLMSITDNVFGLDRLAALGGPALTQAAAPWLTVRRRRRVSPRPIPAFVALPDEARPGFDARLKTHLLGALEVSARITLDQDRSQLVFRCRGGGVVAFALALAELHRGECEAVAVGGVDSYFDPDVLERLDQDLRLHGEGTENGFVPGEGAGFVVLARRADARGLGHGGRVIAAATEEEPHPYGAEEPCLGLGMTHALRGALGAAGVATSRSVSWVLTDVANERHRVDEWSYAFARAHRAFTPDVIHEQPLLKTGDLGAASAAVLLVMVATRWKTGCGRGPLAVIATHSDGPTRGALVTGEEAS